jgi:hypothetical protein
VFAATAEAVVLVPIADVTDDGAGLVAVEVITLAAIGLED